MRVIFINKGVQRNDTSRIHKTADNFTLVVLLSRYAHQTYHSIEEIEAATWDTPYSAGSTNTADGIRMMRQIFRGSGRPDIKVNISHYIGLQSRLQSF